MYQPYLDLREAMKEKGEPLWHDEAGVPRWIEWHPSHLHNIYADEAALLEVTCQSCGEKFRCADSKSFQYILRSGPEPWVPSWGDAPWHGEQQCAGTTMTTDWEVVERWKRERAGWVKQPGPEVGP